MDLQIKRTIILPIGKKEYLKIIDNKTAYRKKLDSFITTYPELFPKTIRADYSFVGYSKNKTKQAIPRRIIRLSSKLNTYDDYLLHPCFVLPYLKGVTKQVSKGLLFRKYNAPYHAIASSFGKSAMYWYRTEVALTQYNIVGTTIKKAENLPKNILLDEHHSKLKKSKLYICTTAGGNCFIGVGISPSMEYDDLKIAYGNCKEELQQVYPSYHPTSINIDGYRSTQKTAKQLYPNAGILRCFAHSFFKIRNCGTKAYAAYFEQVAQKVWNCYYAPNKKSFAYRIWNLEQWTKQVVPNSPFKKAILSL